LVIPDNVIISPHLSKAQVSFPRVTADRLSILLLFLIALQIGNPLLHPVGSWGSFKKMIEIFLHTAGIILLILPFTKAMKLAVVAEEINLFT